MALLSSSAASCTKKTPASTAPTRALLGAEATTHRPTLDTARMLGLLETLSSDEFGGRYTLSDDIARAAALVAQGYAKSGVQPVGDGYTASFSLITAVANASPPALAVLSKGGETKAGKTKLGRDGAFVVLRPSGSGEVQGEAMFVGYAAQGVDASGAVTYDDLAGIDLKGKIAVVLLDAPMQPSVREFWSAVDDQVRAFERDTAKLNKAGKLKALAKKHIALRKRVAKLATPYLRGTSLPPQFTQAPADPLVAVKTRELTAPILFHTKDLPGPKFGRREARLSTKLERLVEAGAAGIVVVKGPNSFVTSAARKAETLPEITDDARPLRTAYDVPIVRVSWKEADRLFRGATKISARQKSIDNKLEPQSEPLDVTVQLTTSVKHDTAEVPNVLGVIPGGDLANEIVLIGAHYDHIGRDEGGPGHCRATGEGENRDDICNGADDNGSGTVIVAELARAIAESGFTPRRTLVFALFAGEELGLLGSEAMANNLPTAAPFDSGKIVAMINIDMVGRLRPELGLAVGGVGSSPGWMPLLDQLDSRGMPIMFDSAVTTRSDHANFFRHDIPVLFLFTHVHGDYHAPGDDIGAINRDGLAAIANYVLDITRAAADGPGLTFTRGNGLVGALPGDDPATVVKRIGFSEAVEVQASDAV
ncbi:MAG: M20/M25/M40 family metallo-hydrolase [Nannocystaceae bacterium]|nr:M20/M25/M40 family metallo-hydrolase [Nannocystaceae bacterium]